MKNKKSGQKMCVKYAIKTLEDEYRLLTAIDNPRGKLFAKELQEICTGLSILQGYLDVDVEISHETTKKRKRTIGYR